MPREEPPTAPGEPDYRFTLANERTFLAWIRTALALVAGGVAAAKALDVHHELVRWIIAVPPLLAGGALGALAGLRHRAYQDAMARGRRLPVGAALPLVAAGVAAYACLVLVATALDG